MLLRLIGLLLAVALFVFLIVKKFDKKWQKRLLLLASFVLILVMTFLYLFPLFPAPRPTGDQEVLTETIFFRHVSEFPEMLTSETEREIPVKVWYPEGAKAQGQPLFLFSHGSFGVADSNETLFLELASRGYVVMSLDHPYHSFMTTLSDGKRVTVDREFMQSVMSSQGSEDLIGTLESLKSWLEIRLEDCNYVLDKLLDEVEDHELETLIDRDRIVLSGHSLGGSAALAIGRERQDAIRGLVILEAPFVHEITGIEGDRYVFNEEEYPLPVLHVYSDALYSKIDEITTYGMNQKLIDSEDPKFVNEHLAGVGHIGLTDMALVSPVLTNLIDGRLNTRKAPETLLELNAYVLEFLGEYNR